MLRIAWITAGVALALALSKPLPAQQRPGASSGPHLRLTERFVGTAKLRQPPLQEVRIAIYNWSIDERQKIAALDSPVKGMMIVQLRGGSLITIIGGKRQKRRTEEFWTIPAGVTMGIETEDDTAVIQTIVIAQ